MVEKDDWKLLLNELSGKNLMAGYYKRINIEIKKDYSSILKTASNDESIGAVFKLKK